MLEVKEKKVEIMEKEGSKQKRTGFTLITSVSISKEFQQLIKKYNLSPTECMRRGIAITLCDIDVNPYNNEYNKARLEEAKKFLDEMRRFKEIKEKLIKIKDVLETLNNF